MNDSCGKKYITNFEGIKTHEEIQMIRMTQLPREIFRCTEGFMHTEYNQSHQKESATLNIGHISGTNHIV